VPWDKFDELTIEGCGGGAIITDALEGSGKGKNDFWITGEAVVCGFEFG
jgi:hypothetical protein